MCFKIKDKLFYVFIIIPLLLFSQQEMSLSQFKLDLKENTHQFSTHPNFAKAQTFFIENEWDSTLVYTMKQLIVSTENQKLNDYCHFFRGYSFYKKGVFKEAENEFSKVAEKFEFKNNITAILGEINLELEQFQKALTYFKAIENLPENKRLNVSIANIKHNIGLCYLHLEKYDLAENQMKKSLLLQEQQKDTAELISSYGDMATLYYQQYKDTLAIKYFKKAYQLAQTTDDFVVKQNTAFNMAVVEENRKDFKKSLQYRKEYEQWKDSLTDQNKIAKVLQLEKKIAVEKEQKEVGILKAENKVKQAERNTFLYSAIILLLLLLVSVYFYREKVKANKIIKAQKESLDELNATKDKLFSIVSHDLRSSVNAIKTSNKKLVNTLETEDLVEVKSLLQNNSAIVNSAYNLLDNLLNWALLQTKQSYFEITKLRLFRIVEHVAYNYKAILTDKEISFENKVGKNAIIYADQESLKIILRNLIDNAIKFSNPKGKIQIYTDNENENFCDVIIEDTGVGMDNTTRKELLKDTVLLSKKKHENSIGTGLGLQLCKSMIKKNHGMFSIESELGKGTKMIISLPKKLPNGER